ncbi:MAG: cytochrome c [Desulfuromonadales bacterium]|nr:cytochrome c [Desulfuromonadales bacterium]
MRHFLANIATYTIAIFLISAAALFGWGRSAQLVISDEPTVLQRFAPAPGHPFEWTALGEKGYRRNCQSCHGPEGRGWDQYPKLDHTASLFLAAGGREYLIDVHLYGLTSARWGAPMPPMAHLHDLELTAVLNHVLTHFGNDQRLDDRTVLYEPEEIGPRRGQELSPWGVEKRRQEIVLPGRQ